MSIKEANATMPSNSTLAPEFTKLTPLPPLITGLSDFYLSLIAPIAVHWLTSLFFEICERTGWLESYRLHPSAEEVAKNRVSRRDCFWVTLRCQALQTLLGLVLGWMTDGEVEMTGNEDYEVSVWTRRVHAVLSTLGPALLLTGFDFESMASASSNPGILSMIWSRRLKMSSVEALLGHFLYWYIVPLCKMSYALVVADALMYCIHRLNHTNKFMYKHLHSVHHRLYVPWSWAGSYNHPFDAIVTDGLSYGIGCWMAGLSTRLCIVLFAYSSFKNVLDHCGYVLPWNPMRAITGTDADFHDVHHQSWGLKMNYGAHLTIWDRMMGTYFSDEEEIARLRKRSRITNEAR